jgi:hypothetical protein
MKTKHEATVIQQDTDLQDMANSATDAHVIAIQQKMYIANLERQLLQCVVDLTERLNQGDTVKSTVTSFKRKRNYKMETPTKLIRMPKKLPFSLLVQSR